MKPQDRELLGAVVGGALLYASDDGRWFLDTAGVPERADRYAVARLIEGGYLQRDKNGSYVATKKGREAAV